MTERGYIVETARGWRGRPAEKIYWVTKGSASNDINKAGLFTRAEFDALHYKERLEFVPVPRSPDETVRDGDT